MKVVTKGELIAKFGERNGSIFWNRFQQAERSKEILQSPPRFADDTLDSLGHIIRRARPTTHPEKNFVIPTSDLPTIKTLVQQGKLDPRMVRWLAETTLKYYSKTDSTGQDADKARHLFEVITELRVSYEGDSLRGMRAALTAFWS